MWNEAQNTATHCLSYYYPNISWSLVDLKTIFETGSFYLKPTILNLLYILGQPQTFRPPALAFQMLGLQFTDTILSHLLLSYLKLSLGGEWAGKIAQ